MGLAAGPGLLPVCPVRLHGAGGQPYSGGIGLSVLPRSAPGRCRRPCRPCKGSRSRCALRGRPRLLLRGVHRDLDRGRSALPPQLHASSVLPSAIPRGRTGSLSERDARGRPRGEIAGVEVGSRAGSGPGTPLSRRSRRWRGLRGSVPAVPVLERHRAGPRLGGARSFRGFPVPPRPASRSSRDSPFALGGVFGGPGRGAPHRASPGSCGQVCSCRAGCDPRARSRSH